MIQKCNEISLSYGDAGTGPAVVLIHGFPLNRAMWKPQENELTAAGFRVISPDLRGFGRSESPEGPYSMSLLADDIIALLDRLGIGKAVFGGMSMGGYVLFNLLERYPERAKAACFIATRSTVDSEAVKGGRLAFLERMKRNCSRTLTELCASTLFAPETRQRDPDLVREVSRWLLDMDRRGIEGALHAMIDRKEYTSRLGGFTLPTLVIGADQDEAVQEEDLESLAKGLPDCEFHIIPHAGHMVNMEQPAAFNECLLRFLRRVTTAGDVTFNTIHNQDS